MKIVIYHTRKGLNLDSFINPTYSSDAGCLFSDFQCIYYRDLLVGCQDLLVDCQDLLVSCRDLLGIGRQFYLLYQYCSWIANR